MFRLTKQAKLIKTDDFSSVFNFRKRISTPHLVIHYLPKPHTPARLGLVVGKKTAKLAVDRNYMRRLLRELYRTQQPPLTDADIIIRVQKAFAKSDFMQIKQEFELLISKLAHRIQAASPVNTTDNKASSTEASC
jgi:ribonuclease P protein component